MPIMDGFEASQTIRRTRAHCVRANSTAASTVDSTVCPQGGIGHCKDEGCHCKGGGNGSAGQGHHVARPGSEGGGREGKMKCDGDFDAAKDTPGVQQNCTDLQMRSAGPVQDPNTTAEPLSSRAALSCPQISQGAAPRAPKRCFFWGKCDCCPTIVAVTANALYGSEDRCKRAGMNGFLAKPLRLADVAYMLMRCIEL